MFQRNLMGRLFKVLSRVFLGFFMGVSRGFNGVLRKFQWHFREVT